MRFDTVLFGALFVIPAYCSAIRDNALHRRHPDVHEQMRRDAEAAVHQREKRVDVFGVPGGVWPTVAVPPGFTLAGGVQTTPLPGSPTTLAASATAAAAAAVPTLSDGSIDSAAWNSKAEMACMTAMQNLNGNAGNPSGMAVCYNVPFLDQNKGLFEAELRMYNVSAPTDGFVGVTPDQMMVSLQYAGATIQANNDSALPVKRDVEDPSQLEKRQTATMAAATTGTGMPATMAGQMAGGVQMPVEVAVRKYVGAINQNLLRPGMNLSDMQPLLIPQISIDATNPSTNQVVDTSLSSSQATFVAGFFSKAAGTVTDPKSILGKSVEQIAAAQEGKPTPFVVPGLSIAVTPVGLIVTCIWTLLFSLSVGLGTVGRIQFRDQYRRAIKEQATADVRRF